MLSEDVGDRTGDPNSNWVANLADKGPLLVQFRNSASMTTQRMIAEHTHTCTHIHMDTNTYTKYASPPMAQVHTQTHIRADKNMHTHWYMNTCRHKERHTYPGTKRALTYIERRKFKNTHTHELPDTHAHVPSHIHTWTEV